MFFFCCFFSVLVHCHNEVSTVLEQGGIISLCATSEWLCGLEHITTAYTDKAVKISILGKSIPLNS